MTTNKLNFGQRVALGLIWGLCRLFGFLPLFVQYRIIAPFIYVVMYHIIGYRRKITAENLGYAFADRTEAERKTIERNFYKQLSEVFVSTLAIASPKMKGKFDDVDDMTTEAAQLREETKNTSWIGLSAHYGMWEHNMFWGEYSGQYTIGAYHKLSNPVMEELFLRLRVKNHPYVVAVERKQMVRFCLKHSEGINGRPLVVGLIADQHPYQNPSKYNECNWINFLGRDTIFFEGGEKLALKMKLPVYFTYYKRQGVGKYSFAYEKLYDGVEEVEPFEITRRYVRRLEAEILQHPEMWLWSHRRWKHKRPQ